MPAGRSPSGSTHSTSVPLSTERLSELNAKFSALLIVHSLLVKRGLKCTLSALRTQCTSILADSSRNIFTLSDLRDLQVLSPGLFHILPVVSAQAIPLNSSAQFLNDDAHGVDFEVKINAVITPATIGTQAHMFSRRAQRASDMDPRNRTSLTSRTTDTVKEAKETNSTVSPKSTRHRKRNLNQARQTDNPTSQSTTSTHSQSQHYQSQSQSQSSKGQISKKKASRLIRIPFDCRSFHEKCTDFSFFEPGCVVKRMVIPARPANCASLESGKWECNIPLELSESLRDWKGIDIRHLYSHQCRAISSLMNTHNHCVIATSTASGKSLCFTIPILAELIEQLQYNQVMVCVSDGDDGNDDDGDGDEQQPRKQRMIPLSRSLLLFPTKALAQDQLRSLNELVSIVNDKMMLQKSDPDYIRVGTYDGDTPFDQRRWTLEHCQIILTNPDMLHITLLPKYDAHPSSLNFFSYLRWVVLDECHSYDSVFGTHVSHVIRRLKRIVKKTRDPKMMNDNIDGGSISGVQFVGCSATIGNPRGHFSALIGESMKMVDCVDSSMDGSSRAVKEFLFWQPPLLEQRQLSKMLQHSKKFREVREKVKKAKKERKQVKKKGVMLAELMDEQGRQLETDCMLGNLATMNSSGKTRRSHMFEASQIFAQFMMAGLRCLAFCPTRSVCELVFKYYLDLVDDADLHSVSKDVMNSSSEVILNHSSDGVSNNTDDTRDELKSMVSSYRGGYNRELRRKIEQGLFGGSLRGVTSTNALELGVDIGGMDATIHIGYPGLASLWQQCGRAGRGDDRSYSCAVFVASENPIDAYLLANAEEVISEDHNRHESVVISPHNRRVLSDHILSAIGDCPISTKDLIDTWLINDDQHKHNDCQVSTLDSSVTPHTPGQSNSSSSTSVVSMTTPSSTAVDSCSEFTNGISKDLLMSVIQDLNGDGFIEKCKLFPDLWTISSKCKVMIADWLRSKQGKSERDLTGLSMHPSRIVSIRNISSKIFTVRIGEKSGKVIDTLDEHSAFFQIFEGAIVLHCGKEYRVRQLDLNDLTAIVEPVTKVNYYTSCRDRTDFVELNSEGISLEHPLIQFGMTTVCTDVFGYWRILKRKHIIIDSIPLELPSVSVTSEGLWIDVPSVIVESFALRNRWISDRRAMMNCGDEIEEEEEPLDLEAAIHSASHAMISLFSLLVKCKSDAVLRTECPNPFDTKARSPRIIIAERIPFGVGFVRELFEKGLVCSLMMMAEQRLSECQCRQRFEMDGCLSCVHSVKCSELNLVASNKGALFLIREMLKYMKKGGKGETDQ